MGGRIAPARGVDLAPGATDTEALAAPSVRHVAPRARRAAQYRGESGLAEEKLPYLGKGTARSPLKHRPGGYGHAILPLVRGGSGREAGWGGGGWTGRAWARAGRATALLYTQSPNWSW